MTDISNPTIQKLIESRIELGQRFMEQSLPVMHLNEDFNSNILTNLYNKGDNRKAFLIIKNKVPAVWTDVVDEMIDVYNKDDVYNEVKWTFDHCKSLSGDTDDMHFPLMIFTDYQDNINCVIGGKQAMHDTIYLSNKAESLLKERYDILMEVKKNIHDKYYIDPDNFPGGNSKKTRDRIMKATSTIEETEWAKVPLQVFFGKLLFDIAAKYNDAKDKSMVKDAISIWKDPKRVYDELTMIADTHRKTVDVTFTTGGEEKMKSSTKRTKSKDVSTGSNTTPAYMFSLAVRMFPSRYRFEDMLDPEFVRDILRLANIRTNSMDSDRKDETAVDINDLEIPTYTDQEIQDADEEEVMEMYDELRAINVRNSLLYSTGHTKDITQADTYSTFNHLFLIPDKISHLYSIGNIPTSRSNRLEDFGDIDDDIPSEPRSIKKRMDDFFSDEEIEQRQHRWEVGVQPRHSSNKYYDARLRRQEPETNVHGYAGDQSRTIHDLRAKRREGMTLSSKERREIEARNRRADAWAADSETDRKGNPKFNAKLYKDTHRKEIAGINIPAQIDASTGKPIPKNEIMLRGYYHDFMASYDSFSDTSKSMFDKLVMRINDFADKAGEQKFANAFKKTLLDYYVILDAAIESAYDIVTSTGGNPDLYKDFCGMLATGAEEPGYFLKYNGGKDSVVQKINKAVKNPKYPKQELQVVMSEMQNYIEELNKATDKLCIDPRHKDYLMLTARRRFRSTAGSDTDNA